MTDRLLGPSVAAVLIYNGREAVKLAGRLWAIPMGHVIE